MQKHSEVDGDNPTPGEFDEILRQIEKEPIPERLLELALKLQSALMERRRQDSQCEPDDDA